MIEDILRREAVAYPGSQAFFWRTAAGAEVDLVIERGGFESPATCSPSRPPGHFDAVAALTVAVGAAASAARKSGFHSTMCLVISAAMLSVSRAEASSIIR